MDSYVTGQMIKKIRESKKYTQKDLAEIISVSEKTISKWETQKGLPDISLLEPLAKALGVSLVELFNGEIIKNQNSCGNILKTKFYVCPICGNIITSMGDGVYSCCGVKLIMQEAEETNDLIIENQDGRLFVHIDC
ncbi:MAG: helix-turn-helix transcriptional regulator [Clostridia bacterium]